MSLKINDERAVLIQDANGGYTETDREKWLNALGASDITILFEDNSSGALLAASFPNGEINPATVRAGFGETVTARLGNYERLIDQYALSRIPVHLVDALLIPSSPL